MSEFEKMVSGEIYDHTDKEIVKVKTKIYSLCIKYNKCNEYRRFKRQSLIKKIFPNQGSNICIRGPIFVTYGKNTHIGNNFFANFNFTVLDTTNIYIGDNVFIGPNTSLCTPIHPIEYKERNQYIKDGRYTDKEYSKGITIGNNVWIGANVTVCPGVNIGNGCVIGAGSVVTRDIPDNTVAVGVPCKVIREIKQ